MALGKADAGDIAVSHFDAGFNCAEATLRAVCQVLGMEHDRVPAVASAFGGGIARRGYTCGAVSGAALAVGLALGRMDASESRNPSYEAMGRFLDEFGQRFGSVMCKDISGVDFLTKEGQREYKERVHAEKCCPVVRFAARRICEILACAGGQSARES